MQKLERLMRQRAAKLNQDELQGTKKQDFLARRMLLNQQVIVQKNFNFPDLPNSQIIA
jgi:hypothetical protein